MSFRVVNVDYTRLRANGTLLVGFGTSIKESVASAVGGGILAEHVHLRLSAGSVMVDAAIIPPDHVSLAAVRLGLASANLEQAVATGVTRLPGIEAASTGPISVSAIEELTAGGERADKKLAATIIGLVLGVIVGTGVMLVLICMLRQHGRIGVAPLLIEASPMHSESCVASSPHGFGQ